MKASAIECQSPASKAANDSSTLCASAVSLATHADQLKKIIARSKQWRRTAPSTQVASDVPERCSFELI